MSQIPALTAERIARTIAGEIAANPRQVEAATALLDEGATVPFIARYRGEIIGFIIGVAIEDLASEPWARLDENFGEGNTFYTYAFVIMDKYKGNGYAKILKRVYLSWAKKRDGIRFVTGHVKLGVSTKFTGDIKIINRVDNWQGTGMTFEYYRRDLGSKPDQTQNPPLVKTF